ncbi:hypothetical protein FSP39_013349 [Pinctada imbricata]|uniref:Uncharacterized protein n=1 Tax=Pinctada imbricata TaxID=66713 RepID=A0AA88Y8F5_PINIB|nr:hypothetical protein FSP39_013349 [Pinctada imbricata]
MLVIASGIDLNWVYMAGAILTIPGLPGLVLSIFWCKSTSKGVIYGSLIGLAVGIAVWFGVGSSYQNGLSDFVKNTSEPIAILSGGLSCFFASLIVTVIVSLMTNNIKTPEDGDRELEKMKNIDNPLSSWIEIYAEDFPELAKTEKPSAHQLEGVFQKAKLVSYIGGAVIALLLVIIVPVTMSTLHVMTFDEFSTWTLTVHCFGLIMLVLVIFPTPIEETYLTLKQIGKNKKQRYLDLKKMNDLKL